MNVIKMQVLTARTLPLNRWDKDSIRPGPVGSVGDVNLQVKLKKSSNDQPDRFQKEFSGKNEVWSGSNISDGQYRGFTSGGRGAVTLTQPLPTRESFRTATGWVIENAIPADRSKIAKMVPLGQYSWEEDKARIYKAKVSGEQFLPVPNGYAKTPLSRGSQNPIIAYQVAGTGVPLPAAEVKITDPIFGESGSIEVDVPACSAEELAKVWTPAMNDPLRSTALKDNDIYRYRKPGGLFGWFQEYPDVGKVQAWDNEAKKIVSIETSPCGGKYRQVPIPTKKERRQAPPKQPEPPKKQKML